MRSVSDTLLFAAAGADSALVLPAIGAAFEGGFYAGSISHTANGVATHALIVAPRATGASGTGYPVTTSYAWKPANTETAGVTSTFDGRANTNAMITAGIAAHPAAQFCVNLTIGGYTDWYLPSRYELDIAYFNLKPTFASNNTSTGINNYSVPTRIANYTSGNPAETAVSAFNSSGSERFVPTSHYTSNQSGAIYGFYIDFTSGAYEVSFKSNALNVRAFRRVAL